jgi:hypothetical protein
MKIRVGWRALLGIIFVLAALATRHLVAKDPNGWREFMQIPSLFTGTSM